MELIRRAQYKLGTVPMPLILPVIFRIASPWTVPTLPARTNRPAVDKSGSLKLVEVVVPNVVPITANKSAYCVREINDPSHFKKPDGTVLLQYHKNDPGGNMESVATCSPFTVIVGIPLSVASPPPPQARATWGAGRESNPHHRVHNPGL